MYTREEDHVGGCGRDRLSCSQDEGKEDGEQVYLAEAGKTTTHLNLEFSSKSGPSSCNTCEFSPFL